MSGVTELQLQGMTDSERLAWVQSVNSDDLSPELWMVYGALTGKIKHRWNDMKMTMITPLEQAGGKKPAAKKPAAKKPAAKKPAAKK